MNRIAVSPRVLRWARDRAGLAAADLQSKFPLLAEWEAEAAQPTMKQLENFAKATRVPFGFLFLPEPPEMMSDDELTEQIIGAAIEVHRAVGPGLLESAYEHCLHFELTSRGIRSERQKTMPIRFKDCEIDAGYRIDLWVEGRVIIELKAVERLQPIHSAQLITYLKLSGCHLGLLINFNEKLLKNGLKRIVNEHPEKKPTAEIAERTEMVSEEESSRCSSRPLR